MIWLAAAAVGTACYLGAAAFVGRTPELRLARRSLMGTTRGGRWLRQAGLLVLPRRFWVGSVASGVITFAVITVLTGVVLVAVVPAIGVGALPAGHYARRRAARLREVQESWPDGLRDLRSSIAAGRSLPQALMTLAETGPAPLRAAFARFPTLSRMLGTPAALDVIKEELADPTSDRVIEVLILGCERGGAIVQSILEDLIVATTRDVKVLDEIETDGLEMRINARAVLALPWAVLVVLTLRAGPFRDFYGSSRGVLVVVVGAVLTAVGHALVVRLGRGRVEPRIFATTPASGSDP